jgi:hypothetical protein
MAKSWDSLNSSFFFSLEDTEIEIFMNEKSKVGAEFSDEKWL